MAIELIGAQVKTPGDTATIPVGTTLAVGFCYGVSISTPTLNGVAMTGESVSSSVVGIYYVNSPVAGNYTVGAQATYFAYFSGTNGFRAGSLASNTADDPFATSIDTSYDDFIVCVVLAKLGGTTSTSCNEKIDGVGITNILQGNIGYRQGSGETADISLSNFTDGYTLYYAFASIQSLVASDQATFMTMIV
jgi:hypothetical protein